MTYDRYYNLISKVARVKRFIKRHWLVFSIAVFALVFVRVLELFDVSSDEPIKTLTINGTTATYLIKDIESGTYTLKVTKDGHTVRTYSVTVGDSTTELNIDIWEYKMIAS